METQQSVQGRNGVLTVCEWSHAVAGGIREFLCVKPPHTQDYEIPVCEGVTHRYYPLPVFVGGTGGGHTQKKLCVTVTYFCCISATHNTHTHNTHKPHTQHTHNTHIHNTHNTHTQHTRRHTRTEYGYTHSYKPDNIHTKRL